MKVHEAYSAAFDDLADRVLEFKTIAEVCAHLGERAADSAAAQWVYVVLRQADRLEAALQQLEQLHNREVLPILRDSPRASSLR